MALESELKIIYIVAVSIISLILLAIFATLIIVGIKVLKTFKKREVEPSISETINQQTSDKIRILEEQLKTTQQSVVALTAAIQQMVENNKATSDKIIEQQKEQLETAKATLEHQQGQSRIDVSVFNDMLNEGMNNLKLEPGEYHFNIQKNRNSIGVVEIPMYVYQSDNEKPIIPITPCSYPCQAKIRQVLFNTDNIKSQNILAVGDSQTGKSDLLMRLPRCFSKKKIVCVLPLDAQKFSDKFDKDSDYSLAMLTIIEKFQDRVAQLAKDNPEAEVVSCIEIDEFDGKSGERDKMLMKPSHLQQVIDRFEQIRERPLNLQQCVIAAANNPQLFKQVAQVSGTTDPMEAVINRFGGITQFIRIKDLDHAAYILLTIMMNKQEYNGRENKFHYIDKEYITNIDEALKSHDEYGKIRDRYLSNNRTDNNSNHQENDRIIFCKEFSKVLKLKLQRTSLNENNDMIKTKHERLKKIVLEFIEIQGYTIPDDKVITLNEKLTDVIRNYDPNSSLSSSDLIQFILREVIGQHTYETALDEKAKFRKNILIPTINRLLDEKVEGMTIFEHLSKIVEDTKSITNSIDSRHQEHEDYQTFSQLKNGYDFYTFIVGALKHK